MLKHSVARELKIAYPLRVPSDDTWERLDRLARAAEPGVRRQFLEAIARIRGGMDEQAVEAALARGDINTVLRLIPFHDLDDALAEAEANLETVRSSAFILGRDTAVPALNTVQLAIHLGERETLRVTWAHVSPNVLAAIRNTTGNRVSGISDSTRQAISQLVERAYAAGKAPRTIVKEIEQIIGLAPKQELAVARYRASLEEAGTPPARVERMVERYAKKKLKERATMIARTETVQAMNDGQRASWQQLVETGLLDGDAWEREWMAIVPTDGRTCPVCESLDGIRAPIDGDYEPEEAKGGPPQHPDCFLPGTLVASGGGITAHAERWFEGEIVRIRVENGHELAVTPNHPILTLRGWVAACKLDESDHVIQAADPNAAVRAVDPENHHVEARIEEIPHALLMAGDVSTVAMPQSPEDFHGDVSGSDEVRIVRPNRFLLCAAHAAAYKGAFDSALGIADVQPHGFDGGRSTDPFDRSSLSPADGVVRSSSASAPLLGTHLRHGNEVPLRDAAYLQTGTCESAANAMRGVAELSGETHTRLAGHVQAVKIAELIRGDRWKGHVYNLETVGGWYIANTVLVHNCRCTEKLVQRKRD